MYTRSDITVDDRLEIFSRYWRFSDDYGTVSRLAEEFRTSRQFVYDVAARVKEALDWRPAGRPEQDQQREQIARLKREGLTILLAEQNVDFSLNLADRVYVLEKGTIRFSGAASELRNNEALRHELLAL